MMKHKIITGFFGIFLLAAQLSFAQYAPDFLGNNLEVRKVQMASDYEGAVEVNLVRLQNAESKKAVLYIHGFCDYFFNVEMAEQFHNNGYQFYALDLRKYGRSMLPNQLPNQCRSLTEYFADIDTALAIMKQEGMTDITCIAHSTGGLTLSLYANARKDQKAFQRIILNSPFLDMNQNWFMENIVVPIVSFLGKFFPEMKLPEGLSGWYGESIHKDFRGEWDYRLDFKPILAFRMDAGWLRAIHKGHQEVQEGLVIEQPILLMRSDKSIVSETWTEDYFKGDGVLDVEDIHKYGMELGPNVKEAIITNGLHDLSLSRKEVRDAYYKEIFLWLNN